MINKKLLIIGHVWPEPKSSAAGSRMMQLIASFQEAGFEIVFASASARSNRAFNLAAIGVASACIELNHSNFNHFVKQLDPDVVLFDRYMTEEQYGWRVAETCPKALRILDTEDLHGLRKGRQQALKEGKAFDASYLYNVFAKREIASIYRCDLSLIISEVEMHLLKESFQVPEALLFYLPFQCEPVSETQLQKLPTFDQREHFITLGNFLHPPNTDSVLYLKESIWPLIKLKLPSAQLHVYGAYVSQKAKQLQDEKSGFLIKGFAEDAHTVMAKARICLAPLRFGAGLKGKLIDAMQAGTPCVMSSIAAEGMFGSLEPNGLIEDAPELFAEQSIRLYQGKDLWDIKQQYGFKVISERFDKSQYQLQLVSKINNTLQMLQKHRFNNFTGQMLQHHTNQSTKYMGKWIEEKNKDTEA